MEVLLVLDVIQTIISILYNMLALTEKFWDFISDIINPILRN